ncbi:Vancomycin B-type resistance protein VanW [compost metagenome]
MPLYRTRFQRWLILFVLCAGAALGGLYIYGSQQTLPAKFTVSGWMVGGYKVDQFRQQLEQKLQALNQQVITLQSPTPEMATKELTFNQLGLVVQKQELDTLLQGLFEAPLRHRIWNRWHMRAPHIQLNIQFDSQKLSASVEQAWKELYKNKPTPAKRIITPANEVIYEPEIPTARIHTDKLREQLNALIPQIDTLKAPALSLRTTLPIYQKLPDVTVDLLKSQGIERKIMESTTFFPPTSAEGRIHNIRSTAESIQDLILKPGEVFDYSQIIARTEAKYGYQEAPVILNGKLVPGIGGGICQVSTTLYHAVLRSGLEIVERRNHSLPISYAPLGQDATYSSGYINFKFRNNTGAYLLIRTSTSANQVTVQFFGRMPDNITYEIESTILQTLQPDTKYVHNPTLGQGKQEKLSEGKVGFVVETYRYKKDKGITLSKELISKDRYSPQPTLIATNSGEPLPNGVQQPQGDSILEDGVKGPNFR